MTKPRLWHWVAALGLGLIIVGAPASAATTAAPASTPVGATLGDYASDARPADARERQLRYAQREAANPRAADFKGNGVGIYIGGSTLAVVLVVVLVLVLL